MVVVAKVNREEVSLMKNPNVRMQREEFFSRPFKRCMRVLI